MYELHRNALNKGRKDIKQSVNSGYFMDVEIKSDVYFSIFSKIPTMNIIYFCN